MTRLPAPDPAGQRSVDTADSVAGGDDDRYVPRVGPALDPYDDQPELRQLVLSPLVASTAQGPLTASERLDVVLALPEPRAVVQALSADEFVLWAKEIGGGDCGELLALASPRQMQACVDLDAWRDDELDTASIFAWLALAAEHGPETAEKFVAAQEDGLLCLALAQHIRALPVHDEVDNELPDDAEVFDSPDGAFKLIAQLDDPELPWVRRMVAVLFGLDMLRARAIIKGLYWELPAQLDDDLRDLRAARLRDLGFEPRPVAQQLYTYRDPYAYKRELLAQISGTGGVGVAVARPYAGHAFAVKTGLALYATTMPPLLGQAMALLEPHEKDRVQLGLLRLAYRVQSARAVAPSEVAELAHWSRHAMQTAALGLQFAADGDLALAAVILGSAAVDDLFTVAHGLVVIEVHRAKRLRTALGGKLEVLDGADAELVHGLLARFPGMPHPIGTPQELQQVQQRLVALDALVALFGASGGAALDVPSDTKWSTLLATALAWRALGQPPSLQPLDLAALRALCGTCFARGQWRLEVRMQLEQTAQGGPTLPWVQTALQRLAEDYAGLDPAGEIDLRFVGEAVLLRR